MRVIAKSALRNFWDRHPDAEEPLAAWYALMRKKEFRTPHELKAEFGTASILADNHVCFNVGGNKYRLVVRVHYGTGIMYIKRVLTHAEYDTLNAARTLVPAKKKQKER